MMSHDMKATELETPDQPMAAKSGLLRYAPLVVIAALLATAYAMGWQKYFTLDYLTQSQEALQAMVAAHPLGAPLAFFAVYAVAVAIAFPAASILTVFAGFLFGWFAGGLIVAFAATTGAMALFLAARSAFGDVLRKRIGGAAKAMAEGFETDAFNYLLFLRLAPIFPFLVINIVPAFFKVTLRTYAGATFLGILPGTFAYAFLGAGIGSSIAAAKAAGTELSLADLVTPQLAGAFLALGLVALIPVIVKRLRARR
jgi:uncharacterized membrane protein YdjX (TVP38/TMEM64 family)